MNPPQRRKNPENQGPTHARKKTKYTISSIWNPTLEYHFGILSRKSFLFLAHATQHWFEPASSFVALSPGICIGYPHSGRRLPPQGAGAGSGESDIRIGL